MRILFVCTGNVFRSASAHYILQKILNQKKDTTITVDSAGTRGEPYGMYSETQARLRHYGIETKHHKYKILTQEIVDEANVIICMAHHHQEFIQQHFQRDSYLFNELAYEKHTDVQDDDEAGVHYGSKGFDAFIDFTVDYIYEAIPYLYKRLKTMDF